mmetsp:Transcript_17473/g.26136  ORF Transcript_17473/g.26136 Transcript_17473/m.26136 type:complete len:206 (-) Transcript_17473:493-1110(-)
MPTHYKQYDKKIKVQYHNTTKRRRRFGLGTSSTFAAGSSHTVRQIGIVGRVGRGINLFLMRISNNRSIFNFLRFGVGLFVIVYTVTFWRLGSIARHHYYYHQHDFSSSVGRLNSFKSETATEKVLHHSMTMDDDHIVSLQVHSKDEYYNDPDRDRDAPMSPYLYGPEPDNNEFSESYAKWDREHRESFERMRIERQHERKRRTSN